MSRIFCPRPSVPFGVARTKPSTSPQTTFGGKHPNSGSLRSLRSSRSLRSLRSLRRLRRVG
eukprot:11159419-Lingulodinium_polyedra.AAC.1